MQNLQNNQVFYSAVTEALVKTPVSTVVLPELSSEVLEKYKKTMESFQQEQQHNVEKSIETPFFSPGGPIFWILVGAILYFIISKLNKNKRNFLDFVDKMWSEIHFLRKDGEILSKEVQQILKDFETKTHLFDEKYGIVMRNLEEMQQVIDKPKRSHKKVNEKITMDLEPIHLPGLDIKGQDTKKDGFGF